MSVSKYCSFCRPVPAAGAAQGLLITDPVSNLDFLLSVWLCLSTLSVFPLPSSLSRILPSADGSNIIQACCYTCRQRTGLSHSQQQCLHFLLPSKPLHIACGMNPKATDANQGPPAARAQDSAHIAQVLAGGSSSLSGDMRMSPRERVPTMVRLHWPSW